ncbi:hypothetical protein WJX72_012525 [[Myrmecia] bisecta]|uniref:SnoaL-like domain-containing protein n=1 Tax=[Myrmecia] bisecta TaxID=41462 RepID=A0AAW1R994_9CHLO
MNFAHDSRVIIYPSYLNSKKTVAEGRRLPVSKGCEHPSAPEILDCCIKHLKLQAELENKAYSRDYMLRGRVRVELTNPDGSPVNPHIPSRKVLFARHASPGSMAAVVKKAYRFYGEGALDAMLELCADDIKFWGLGEAAGIPTAGTYTGKDGIKELLGKTNKYFKTEDMEKMAFIESKDGKTVTVPHIWAMTTRTQGGSTKHSSRSNSVDVVTIWEVVDDKITTCYLVIDDIEYWHLGEENAIPFAGTYKGKDAFKGLLEKADKYFKTEEMDAEAFIESKDGKTITVPGVSTVTPRTQGGSTEHSSRSTSLDQVVIWEVVDDKITKCCDFPEFILTCSPSQGGDPLAGLHLTSTMAAVVKQVYLCFTQGDLDGLSKLVADDVDIWTLGKEAGIPFAGTYKGKDGLFELFEKQDKCVKTENLEAKAFIESKDGKTVVVPSIWTMTPRQQGEGAEHSGRPTVVDVVSIWEVADDKIAGFRDYYDTWKVAHALHGRKGLQPEA